MHRRTIWQGRGFVALTMALFLGSISAPVVAQTYPTKPIIIKMAYPAGGPADSILRDFLPTLQRELGQPVVVENMPGANGSIAAMSVQNAPADGYTLLGTLTSDFILAPLTIPTAKYKPTDFRAVGLLGSGDFVLLSSPKRSFQNVDQLIDYAKANPDKKLSIGHWGTGSLTHVISADFAARAGIKLLQVPYKGASATIPDLGSGQIDLTFYSMGGALAELIKAGIVKPVAIASAKRNPQLPDVPTLSESRYLNVPSRVIISPVAAGRCSVQGTCCEV